MVIMVCFADKMNEKSSKLDFALPCVQPAIDEMQTNQTVIFHPRYSSS